MSTQLLKAQVIGDTVGCHNLTFCIILFYPAMVMWPNKRVALPGAAFGDSS